MEAAMNRYASVSHNRVMYSTSEASVAVRKQRAEQRETLEQSERSQAHRGGDNSWDQIKHTKWTRR